MQESGPVRATYILIFFDPSCTFGACRNSFNTPTLANHDTLQASQHFQDSRFTQVCRHVSERWQDGAGVRDGIAGGGPSANMADDLMDIMQSMQGQQV